MSQKRDFGMISYRLKHLVESFILHGTKFDVVRLKDGSTRIRVHVPPRSKEFVRLGRFGVAIKSQDNIDLADTPSKNGAKTP